MPLRLGHVRALDGVRGIAIALIVVFHLGWIHAGFVGVDVFFVLSGFLITTLLLEERASGRLSLRRFYARRARRLLPAAFALVVVLGLLAAMAGVLSTWAPYLAASVFYSANLYQVFWHQLPGPLLQLWSLAQEEQFYFVWPLVLVWWLRRPRSTRTAVLTLLVLAAAVMAWRAFLLLHVGETEHASLSPDTRSDGLLVGCALALARARGWRLPASGIIGPAALAATVAGAIVLHSTNPVEASLLIPFAVASSAYMISAALEERSLLARLLRSAPLASLGVISYSIYVWHLAVFMLTSDQVLKLVLAIAAGAVSYRFIEQPFRRGRVREEMPVAVPLEA